MTSACHDQPVRRWILGAALLLLPGLGLLAGGIFELVVQRTGTPAKARVLECHDVAGKIGSGVCAGMWVEGGSLVAGDGHVVTGTIDGADPGDVGKTLDVRLSGGRAYTTSLRIPIILLVAGLALLGLWIRYVMTSFLAGRRSQTGAEPDAAEPSSGLT